MQMSSKMSSKSLGVFVAVIGFCCIGLAAQNDPFLGIWALNVDQTSNYPMKSQLIINVPSPDSPDAFISMRASINKNGQSSTEIHPVAFDGKPHQTDGGDPREISYKRIDANTVERTQNRAGKITVDQEQVSKDGKTLTVTQPGGIVRTYSKQFSVQPVKH